ncbi:MAG: 50S ribosomal protein L21e [Nanoarchaeota archaeon]|nr:50S ribosomal protein L21e [Nanoarchaeota archaeon]MBU1135528.1 50S ribosomal protein L21e [Nanoarchaeota archaeon]MBU2519758.1 50S ribosomal protein L21e [Nanoarchaeota archaeon]
MSRASRGFRTGTRSKLKQKKRAKFKSETYLKEFKIDDSVVIKIEPSSHKGMPFPKFNGKIGTVIDKRGKSYIVKIGVGNSKKDIIARPEHLKIIKA